MTSPRAPSGTSRPVWVELEVRVPERDEETVVAALDRGGSAGGWVAAPGVVRGYWRGAAADAVSAFHAAWRDLAPDGEPPDLSARLIPDEDWTARWRETVEPIAVGPRLWIAPPDAPPPPGGWPDGAVLVRILPGLGFGTGTHPTTRALLRWLESEPGYATVLDVGTGSGVLAIAAVRLGARLAVGLDPDPMALENAAGNARASGAGDAVRLVRGTIDAIGPVRFDRVVANLDRTTLEAILPDLAARCADDGRLGVAGLLAGEREPVLAVARAAGLEPVDEDVSRDAAAGDVWWSGWLARRAA